MKTVAGEIVLTKKISLSKAAKVLSNFVAAENGASQAVSAYLKRASNSFNELAHFHKELKTSKHEQWSRNNGEVVKFGQRPEDPNVEESVGCNNARKTHKKRRKKIEEDDDVELVNSADQSYSNKDKKRRKIEVRDY